MRKRLTIFAIFFTAFAIVLAHDLIPHHHDIESAEHYEQHHDGDSPISDLLSHFQHMTIASRDLSSHLTIAFKKIKDFNPQKERIPTFVFYFFKSGGQDLHDYPDNALSVFLLAAFPRRGPPFLSA